MKLGAFIIPTGIGASIGGYAGDASFWARKLSQKCKLIVNPNVVNAACFSGITDNMLYVEGYSLDEFFKGNLNLVETCNNRIGVVFDKSIPEDVLNVHINTINAVKTIYGIDIVSYEITDLPVGVSFFVNESGVSVGNVDNLLTLKKAANKLIQKGAEAIAVVCHFPEDESCDYENGIGVDPVGGVEAIISHYISKEFNLPCAHAPAFSDINVSTNIVSPKCAAEYITPTFLPCILLGLDKAPMFSKISEGININDLDFLTVPHNALGSIPVLEMLKNNKKVFAILENSSVLNVSCSNFIESFNLINLNSYEDLLSYL